MKTPQLTIKDIARSLNVSISTVSRALKDHPDISQETKDMVRNYAEKFNYRPNVLALSLRRQRSYSIGLIIPVVVSQCTTATWVIKGFDCSTSSIFDKSGHSFSAKTILV